MLRSVHIKNFKCLRDVKVELGDLTVLIGKNDTGKTSFLEAMQLLGRLLAPENDGRGIGSIERLVTHNADPAEITWSVSIEATARNGLPTAARYALTVAPERKLLLVVGESCKVGNEANLSFTKKDERDQWQYEVNDLGLQERPSFESPHGTPRMAELGRRKQGTWLKRVSSALTATALYRLDPRQLAKDSPILDEGESSVRLTESGYGLPAVLDYLLGVARTDFDTIEAELRDIAPFIRSVRLRPTRLRGALKNSPQQGKSLAFALEPSGHEIPAAMASDGILLFLAYLTMVHGPDAPASILLEEPENGVHPRRLESIARFLTRLSSPDRGSRQTQVLVATHSPYLLDYVPPENVLVFGRRSNGDTVVRRISELPMVQQRMSAGLSLGEMWFNVGEDKLLEDVLKD